LRLLRLTSVSVLARSPESPPNTGPRIGDMAMKAGLGNSVTAPPALEVSQADGSPLTMQVGPELREDSEPETCGLVCATAGTAAVRNVPAVTMPMIHDRMAFSPSHVGGEDALTTLRMEEMNALAVPPSLDLRRGTVSAR
jgi:hypothetical protein